MPLQSGKPQRGQPVLVDRPVGVGGFTTMSGKSGINGSEWQPITFVNGWTADSGSEVGPTAVLRWGPICFIRVAISKASATSQTWGTLPSVDYIPDLDVVVPINTARRKSNERNNQFLIIRGNSAVIGTPGDLEVFQYDSADSDDFYTQTPYFIGID